MESEGEIEEQYMALNATMYRFTIDLSDLDRGVYENLSVHVALHPSETLGRMAVRLLAFCLNYDESLQFTKGLSTEAEPDLWRKSYSDEVIDWIEVGLPDAKRLKKACAHAEKVMVYAYGGQAVEPWLKSLHKDLGRIENLHIFQVDTDALSVFSDEIQRSVSLSCMIQDGEVNLSWDANMVDVSLTSLQV